MIKKVKDLIIKPLNDVGIKVDDVLYEKENGVYFLRVIIDKEPFVDIDTCVKATDIINPLVDKLEDEFDDSYVLDVSSKEKGEF